jgi:hypothetical protein
MCMGLRCRLTDCQYEFVKGRSTVLNLLEYFSFVLKSIVNVCQVDYTDFSKAFDKVRHHLLLDKMSFDVEPSVDSWVLTFLEESSA